MEKINVICYINSAGVNFLKENISDTILSVDKNINTTYKFFIVTDSDSRAEQIRNIFELNKLFDKLLKIEISQNSWAKSFNSFVENYKNMSNYLLCSHDDLIVETFDFFNKTIEEISGYEDSIAWIGFTSNSYYKKYNLIVPQSAREVFSKDRLLWPRVFELHNMGSKYDESLLNMPSRACKVPGLYPHFNLIKFSNLEKIGLCPEWGNYTLLIDEHWSLQSLINNLWSIWIPTIFYEHPIRGEQRTIKDLQNQGYVENCFFNYWGIKPSGLSDSQIQNFCDRFPNTSISFFNNKNTFDYQYLK